MQCIAKYVSIAVSRGFPRSSARMWGDEKEDGAKPLRQPRGRKAKPNSGSQKKYASFSLVIRQLWLTWTQRHSARSLAKNKILLGVTFLMFLASVGAPFSSLDAATPRGARSSTARRTSPARRRWTWWCSSTAPARSHRRTVRLFQFLDTRGKLVL